MALRRTFPSPLRRHLHTPVSTTRAFSTSPRVLKSGPNDLSHKDKSSGSYPSDLSTNAKTKTDAYPDDQHAVNKAHKGDTYNIQEASAKAGMDSAKKEGRGGNATEERDSTGGKAKAKNEYPAAPDPAIGMQDERGGRGG